MSNEMVAEQVQRALEVKKQEFLQAASEIARAQSLFNGGSPLKAPVVVLTSESVKAKPKAKPVKKAIKATGESFGGKPITIPQKITAFLTKEGESIASEIAAACGGKSAQTTLSDMVKRGLVKRAGERGSSTYSLAK